MSGLEGDSVLVGVDRVSGRTLVAQVAASPRAARKIAPIAFDGPAIDLGVTVRCGGDIPVVPSLAGADSRRKGNGRPGPAGPPEHVRGAAARAPGIGDRGIGSRN